MVGRKKGATFVQFTRLIVYSQIITNLCILKICTLYAGVEFKQKLQLASRPSRYKNQLAPPPRYSTSPTIMGTITKNDIIIITEHVIRSISLLWTNQLRFFCQLVFLFLLTWSYILFLSNFSLLSNWIFFRWLLYAGNVSPYFLNLRLCC